MLAFGAGDGGSNPPGTTSSHRVWASMLFKSYIMSKVISVISSTVNTVVYLPVNQDIQKLELLPDFDSSLPSRSDLILFTLVLCYLIVLLATATTKYDTKNSPIYPPIKHIVRISPLSMPKDVMPKVRNEP